MFDFDFVLFKDSTMGEVILQASSAGNVYPIFLAAKSPVVSINLALSSSRERPLGAI